MPAALISLYPRGNQCLGMGMHFLPVPQGDSSQPLPHQLPVPRMVTVLPEPPRLHAEAGMPGTRLKFGAPRPSQNFLWWGVRSGVSLPLPLEQLVCKVIY